MIWCSKTPHGGDPEMANVARVSGGGNLGDPSREVITPRIEWGLFNLCNSTKIHLTTLLGLFNLCN